MASDPTQQISCIHITATHAGSRTSRSHRLWARRLLNTVYALALLAAACLTGPKHADLAASRATIVEAALLKATLGAIDVGWAILLAELVLFLHANMLHVLFPTTRALHPRLLRHAALWMAHRWATHQLRGLQHDDVWRGSSAGVLSRADCVPCFFVVGVLLVLALLDFTRQAIRMDIKMKGDGQVCVGEFKLAFKAEAIGKLEDDDFLIGLEVNHTDMEKIV